MSKHFKRTQEDVCSARFPCIEWPQKSLATLLAFKAKVPASSIITFPVEKPAYKGKHTRFWVGFLEHDIWNIKYHTSLFSINHPTPNSICIYIKYTSCEAPTFPYDQHQFIRIHSSHKNILPYQLLTIDSWIQNQVSWTLQKFRWPYVRHTSSHVVQSRLAMTNIVVSLFFTKILPIWDSHCMLIDMLYFFNSHYEHAHAQWLPAGANLGQRLKALICINLYSTKPLAQITC